MPVTEIIEQGMEEDIVHDNEYNQQQVVPQSQSGVVTRSQQRQQQHGAVVPQQQQQAISQQQAASQQLSLQQNNFKVQQYIYNSNNDVSKALETIQQLQGGVDKQMTSLIQQLREKFHADEQVRKHMEQYVVDMSTRINNWVPLLDDMQNKISNIDADVALCNESGKNILESHTSVAARVRAIEDRIQQCEDKMGKVVQNQQAVEKKIEELFDKMSGQSGPIQRCEQKYYKWQKRVRENMEEYDDKLKAIDQRFEEQAGWSGLKSRLECVEERLVSVQDLCQGLNPPPAVEEQTAEQEEPGRGRTLRVFQDDGSDSSDDEQEQEEAAPQLPPATTQDVPPAVPASGTPAAAPSPAPATSGGWRVQQRRRKRAQSKAPDTSRCVFVANQRLQSGKWAFKVTSGEWRPMLQRMLGQNAYLLQGVQMVQQAADTRMCLQAQTSEARRALVVALRQCRQLRVFPALTEQEKRNKSTCFNFARGKHVKAVDRGDMVGLCGPRETIPARLPLAPLNVDSDAFYAHLQRLLGLARRRGQPSSLPHGQTHAPHCESGRPRVGTRSQHPAPRQPPRGGARPPAPHAPCPSPDYAWVRVPRAVYAPPSHMNGPWRQSPPATVADYAPQWMHWQPQWQP